MFKARYRITNNVGISILGLLFFILLWLGLSPLSQNGRLQAQKAVGIHWKVPDSQQEAVKQLKAFHTWGIRHLLVHTKLDSHLLELSDSLDYRLYVSIPNYYTTDYQLRREGDVVVKRLREYGRYYEAQNNLEAFGLFHLSQFNKESFRKQTRPLISDFRDVFNTPVYFTTARPVYQDTLQKYDFYIHKYDLLQTVELDTTLQKRLGGVLISPPLSHYSLRGFQKLMQSEAFDLQTPVFLESTWLLAQTNQHPKLASVIRTFATESDPLLSTPEPSPEPENSQWLVLVLIALWATFAIHYAFIPTFRKSLFRYFLTHHFFVNDILERRMRAVSPGIIILIQQALLGGLFFYLLSAGLFSNYGLDVLFKHYPFLTVIGQSRFVFFVLGILFMLVTQIIYLLWLYLLHSEIKFFNQVVLLYAWPQQLNFIPVTFMVTFYLSGNIGTLYYVFCGLFGLIWLMSFYFTAGDLTHLFRVRRLRYITYTTGLHTLILIILFFYIYVFSPIPDVLQLANALP